MKNKKTMSALQSTARNSTFWPNDSLQHSFSQFSSQVKLVVLQNLSALPVGGATELAESWHYVAGNECWNFALTEMLALETKPGVTKSATVQMHFTLDRQAVSQDLAFSIEMLDDEIKEWRKSLIHVRKLQLQHIHATEGQEAYLEAVERHM